MHNMAIENGAERHWSEALQLTEQVNGARASWEGLTQTLWH
jgi:hypothetical protein